MYLKTAFLIAGVCALASDNLLPTSFAESKPDQAGYRNTIGIQMVAIQPGSFAMGQPKRHTKLRTPWSQEKDTGADWDEQPIRNITLTKPYYMAATEVTNAQFEQFAPEHRNVRPGKKISVEDNDAAANISWEDAVRFCEWLSQKEGKNYRLPTEAEWEYACRAATTTLFNLGDTLPDGYQQIVIPEIEGFKTYFPKDAQIPAYYQAVKSVDLRTGAHPANAWGLFDMHGNVQEWCLDWYAAYNPAETKDPVGPVSGDSRIVRGGAHTQFTRQLRSANRSSMLPYTRNAFTGFRIVQAAPIETPTNAEPPAKLPSPLAALPFDNMKPHFEGPQNFVNIPPNSNGPLYSQHNHDTAVACCANGDILALWYTCDEEPGAELAVAYSRLSVGTTEWTKPAIFWDLADQNDHAPGLFQNDDGTLIHFNGNRQLPGSLVRYSKDNGATWTKAVKYAEPLQPNEATIKTKEGRILNTLDSKWQSSEVVESRDNGQTWKTITDSGAMPDFAPGKTGKVIAGIHCGLVECKDGSLMAVGRFDRLQTFGDRMPMSRSTDGGQTWTYSSTDLPGISSGQRFTLKRLHEGPLLLCSFSDQNKKKNAKGEILGIKTNAEKTGIKVHRKDGTEYTGYGLYAALSFDEGKTWTVKRLVVPEKAIAAEGTDGGKLNISDTFAEQGGYLSMCQESNGKIHLLSSKNHYSFNLAWLLEGTGITPALQKSH